MRISDFLKKNTRVEAELLLAHVLKKPREFLFMHPEFILTSKHLNILSKYIKRREKGEPIAYILGYKDFMGQRFKVNKDVLIPRPETEWLVDRIVKSEKLKVKSDRIRILDVGTGSGAIIISLAKILKANSHKLKPVFYASDISKKALKVARANAQAHGVKIRFIHSDILQNMRMSYDVIVANLPYGWNEWRNNTSAETIGLKFEPKQALFTEDDGLYLINKLLKQVMEKKHRPMHVFLEFDPRQKKQLEQNIKKYLPTAVVKFYKDFAKKWRCVEIAIPQAS